MTKAQKFWLIFLLAVTTTVVVCIKSNYLWSIILIFGLYSLIVAIKATMCDDDDRQKGGWWTLGTGLIYSCAFGGWIMNSMLIAWLSGIFTIVYTIIIGFIPVTDIKQEYDPDRDVIGPMRDEVWDN